MSPGKVNMSYNKNIRRMLLSKIDKQLSEFRYTIFLMMIIKSAADYLLHRVKGIEDKCVTRVSEQILRPPETSEDREEDNESDAQVVNG